MVCMFSVMFSFLGCMFCGVVGLVLMGEVSRVLVLGFM